MKDLSQEELDLEEKALENKAVSRRSQAQIAPAESTGVDSTKPSMSSKLDSNSTTAMKIQKLFGSRVDEAAQKYDVDPKAVATIIHRESSGDSTARNPKSSATGLGQFITSTGNAMGITNPTSGSQSIDATARLLRENLDKFGSYDKALAAHHEGSTVMQNALDSSIAETGSDTDYAKYISPEAQTELKDFKSIYTHTYGGDDSTLYAPQSASNSTGNSKLDYELGIDFKPDRYPINVNDPRLKDVPDSNLKAVIEKNRQANAIYGNAEAQQGTIDAGKRAAFASDKNSLWTGAGRAGKTFRDIVNKSLPFPKPDPNAPPPGVRMSEWKKYIAEQGARAAEDSASADDFDKYASTAQRVGRSIPGLAAQVAASEYIIPKLGLSLLAKTGANAASKFVSEVSSKVPGQMAAKVAKAFSPGDAALGTLQGGANKASQFLANQAVTGGAQGATSVAGNVLDGTYPDMKTTIADGAIDILGGAAVNVVGGSLGSLLKKAAPGALRRALNISEDKLTRNPVIPQEALDNGLIKNSNGISSGAENTKRFLKDKEDKLQIDIDDQYAKTATDRSIAASDVMDALKKDLDNMYGSVGNKSLDPQAHAEVSAYLDDIGNTIKNRPSYKDGKMTPEDAHRVVQLYQGKLNKHFKNPAANDALTSSQIKAYDATQKAINEEIGTKAPELRDLVKQQSKVLPLKEAIETKISKDKMSLPRLITNPYIIGAGLGGVVGAGGSGGDRRLGFAGGALAGLASGHALSSVGGAAAMNTLGKWLGSPSEKRNIVGQVLRKSYDTDKRSKK